MIIMPPIKEATLKATTLVSWPSITLGDCYRHMKTPLDDKDVLLQMFESAVIYFDRHVDSINALNVFPVPDGDTGTNMYRTLLGTKKRLDQENPTSISELTELMKLGTLYEGRGNSGVILSQVFSGIHEGISGGENIDTSSLVSSLSNASDMAYSSVHDPVEGTMLTVLREVAKEASLQSKAGASICEAFDPLVEAAYISVNQTPDQLPVLKEGGVVDSGGYGIEILLRGMALGLAGKDPKIAPLHLRYPKGDGIKHMIDSHHEKDDLYGYCTQFVLTSSDSKKDDLINLFDDLGSSVVIVGEGEIFRIHLHCKDPGVAITNSITRGSISEVSIEDMENQSSNFAHIEKGNRSGDNISYKKRSIEISTKTTALVQVASGDGLEKLLFDAGVTMVISGGDSMNPSTNEILEAINDLENRSIVLMPNNNNIISAAQNAARLSKNNVVVTSTNSVSQGLECAFEFDPDATAEENQELFKDVLDSVVTCFCF
ncbi:MAG: DAK2 domain-containing protein [Dehalococcoidia bacterium]